MRSVILNGLWKKPCATAGTASSTSARLTRWCGTMRTIILWPTTTQRRRRASAITAWTKWRICPFWKSPGWARRHSNASTWRSTPNRCSGCSAGAQQDVELRFAARLAGVVLDRFGKEVTLLPTAAAFSGCMCRPSSAPVHGLGGRLRHGRKAAWAACRGAGIHRLLPGDARAVRISVKSPDYGTYNILY